MSVDEKGKAASILVDDLMSSEESDFEGEGPEKKLLQYKVKRLPWERRKMRNIKRKLDHAYHTSLSRRARDRVVPRIDHENLSDCPVPQDVPVWAVREPQPDVVEGED